MELYLIIYYNGLNWKLGIVLYFFYVYVTFFSFIYLSSRDIFKQTYGRSHPRLALDGIKTKLRSLMYIYTISIFCFLWVFPFLSNDTVLFCHIQHEFNHEDRSNLASPLRRVTTYLVAETDTSITEIRFSDFWIYLKMGSKRQVEQSFSSFFAISFIKYGQNLG